MANLFGGPLGDNILGTALDDLILGLGGDDVLFGGDGDDVLSGGSGNDRLTGDRGSDEMIGGRGDDVMVWNNGDGSDAMRGGSGYDTALANGSDAAGDEFVVSADGANVDFNRLNLVPFKLDISTTEVLDVNGGGGDDRIAGSTGLDGLIRLDFDGGAGDDRLFGGDGDDRLYGGADDDLIVGNRGGDYMSGGRGDDVMVWNNGDGSDAMRGGSGYDTALVNGSDADGDEFVVSADGANIDFNRLNLVPFKLDISTTEVLDVNGGGGDDRIAGSTGLDGLIRLDFDGGAGDDQLFGGDGGDRLYGGADDDLIVGNRGGDTMSGGAGDDVMVWNNGDGSDAMRGGSGYDTALVNGSDAAGDEFVVSADGANVDFNRLNLVPFKLDISTTEVLDVNGGGGDDRIAGSSGLDGLIRLDFDGGAGDDRLLGGDGDDRLYGGADDDLIVGNRGGDYMSGGRGDDVMVWNNGDGSDAMRGGSGYDTALVNGSDAAGDEFVVSADGANIDFNRLNLVPFKLDISTTEVLDVNGGGGDDRIAGSSGLDGLIRLDFDGGAGDDWIRGGDGDDVLSGGRGDDALTGRAGADTFVFRWGHDVVRDFHAGEDEIDLSAIAGLHDFADLEPLVSEYDGDTVIDFGSSSLTLRDVALAELGANDFLF